MFFSLDRLVTKNQILKTKCQQKFFGCHFICIGEEDRIETKNFSWHLVFSIWFLVNEKNNPSFWLFQDWIVIRKCENCIVCNTWYAFISLKDLRSFFHNIAICNIRNWKLQFISWPKLYIPSTKNISRTLLSTAIWAGKKWAGFWQISLYIHCKYKYVGSYKR